MAVHPRIYHCSEAKEGLRSVDGLRRDIEAGDAVGDGLVCWITFG